SHSRRDRRRQTHHGERPDTGVAAGRSAAHAALSFFAGRRGQADPFRLTLDLPPMNLKPVRFSGSAACAATASRRLTASSGSMKSGTTRPMEKTVFAASSTLMESGRNVARGTKRRKPEVGFGTVGTKTLVSFSPVSASVCLISPFVSPTTKHIAHAPGRGYSTSATSLKDRSDC